MLPVKPAGHLLGNEVRGTDGYRLDRIILYYRNAKSRTGDFAAKGKKKFTC